MNRAGKNKLEQLRVDYEAISGRSFKHFFCPILFRDEDVHLCRAHVVNEAFRGSARSWTIQRADVDSFYGSVFESDFVALQERGKHRPVDVLGDKELSRHLRPKLMVDGREVEHFVTRSPVPPQFSELMVENGPKTVHLGLKLHPNEMLSAIDGKWEIHLEKDVRLAALCSLLKAAHLTLFDVLGYEYALSAGGHFLGRTVLGDFYLTHGHETRPQVLESATQHFTEFINMVRPVLSHPAGLSGTVTDRSLYLCQSGRRTWALIVLVRTGDLWHAVLVPVFEDPESAAQFLSFLREPPPTIEVRLARFEGDHWETSPNTNTFVWPKVSLS